MKENELAESNGQLIEQVTKFESLLDALGLPSQNIIASVDERKNIMTMLPGLIDKIPKEQKRDATYLSKFVAGAAIGLFDASLNYVWNEVVISLRKKIVYFGLDIFFENAVSQKIRDQYKCEDDLSGIKDRTMLDTMRKLEWISDIVYRKLSHILDMRNQIGASHPNTYDINSYELLGWLQTCVKEVINDKPSCTAIRIREIIENLKKTNKKLDVVTIKSIGRAVSEFSSGMAANLLRALFSIFVSDDTTPDVRENVLLLTEQVWKYCRDDIKYDLGEKKELYRNNLQQDKERLAYTFFEKCNGLSYFSLTERSLQLSSLCDELLSAHNGWDNYYNEPPIAKEIMKYIRTSGDIPQERVDKLISTFLECRIGREVNYCQGVSQGALRSYDTLFQLLSEEQVKIVIVQMKYYLQSLYSGKSIRATNAGEIIKMLRRTDLSDRINEILDYIIRFSQKNMIDKVYKDKGFKDLTKGIIDFS